MENELVLNNITLASLRGLLRAARKNVARIEAVSVELRMWNFSSGNATENIGVYRSGTGEGTQEFKSMKEARAYIESWKEESNASD